jgi:hypothetical protein
MRVRSGLHFVMAQVELVHSRGQVRATSGDNGDFSAAGRKTSGWEK